MFSSVRSSELLALASLALTVGFMGCGGGDTPARTVVTALTSGSPDELGRVLVEEEGKIVDVCSDFEVSATPPQSTNITTLLKEERKANLGSILDALRGPKTAAAGAANSCRSDDLATCATDIKTAYDGAIKAGGQLAEVAKGMDAAFGKVSSMTPETVTTLATRIRFSMLAVDGYVRLAQSLERELDEFVAGLDIPIPLVSSIARAVVREAAAEVIAAGTDKVVGLLEQHSLVHRPSMIRQACERYLGERASGVVASRGLQRIILSPGKNPTEFIKRRCDLIQVTAKDGTASKTYDGCAVIAAAAKTERPSAKAVVAKETAKETKLAEPSEVKQEMPPALPLHVEVPPAPSTPPPDPKSENAKSATTMQTAALACQELAAGKIASPVPCTLGTFNALGSAATMAPPTTDPQTDTPDTRTITDLVRRVEELVAAQGRTAVTVEKLRTDLESFGGTIDSRLDSVERVLGALSFAQRDTTSVVTKCQEEQRKVRAARSAAFNALGTGPTFESLCGAYQERWVARELKLSPPGQPNVAFAGSILVSVAELCSEQLPVSTAVTFEGGLFDTGKATLSNDAKLRLGAVWSALKPAVAAASSKGVQSQQRAEVLVFGHVDPQPFQGESGKRQTKLMEQRAESAVAHLHAENPNVTFKAGVGHVPAPASCLATHKQCSIWRTVSLEYAALFPVFTCK